MNDFIDELEWLYFPKIERERIKREIGEKEFKRCDFRREACYVFVCGIAGILKGMK